MDLRLEKPSHVFAVILLVLSFILFFVLPIYTFIVIQIFPDIIENIEITESIAIQTQLIVIASFIIVPFLWYHLVNRLKLKEILNRIKLVGRNIDKAFLWGMLAAAAFFILVFLIEVILISMGQKPSDLSNIPDIQRIFSPLTMFILVGIQPVGEEIFFRGFIYEKIEGHSGGLVAIVITSLLFGIAHMGYGKVFPVLMPVLMGLVLGLIVYKTKNLYSAIIAHITFNLTSLFLAYFSQELLENIALSL
jgi:membrane protease YdiL (CAAX protease family)